ncbi:hypothetical protein RCH07_001740 [Arthrobacter sp. CG_A4]|nr:hypothetical protein [Arthrobacter sp. CG_A4]
MGFGTHQIVPEVPVCAPRSRYGELPRTTLKSDKVFGNDGGIYRLATMAGPTSGGFTAGLNVSVWARR